MLLAESIKNITKLCIGAGRDMNINSMLFLTAFLPVVFILDRLCFFCGEKWECQIKNILLLLASLIFYAWGEPVYILLLLFSIVLNYLVGLVLAFTKSTSRIVLAAGIIANLAVLGYYKYFIFFLHITNRLIGRQLFELQNISYPIGISFFTFSAIAYLVDLYRGHYGAEKNPIDLALFLSFFPKISVGPIVLYKDFGKQMKTRTVTLQKTAEGIRRFCYGLGKMILISNVLGNSADKIYAQDIGNVTGLMVWCAALLYTLQIYYDFSGFSDMAVGLSRMFGFEICENFNYPYLSGSIQEFWRRWHISLGNWFRDYLYIPLGGNRKGKVRTYINLGIVFLATGLWHGASAAFIFWGMMHGFFMILERLGLKKVLDRTKVLKYIYTMLIVVFGWVIFREGNLIPALSYIQRMMMPWRYTVSTFAWQELVSNRCIVMVVIGVLGTGIIQSFLQKYCPAVIKLKGGFVEMLFCMFLAAVAMLYMVNGTYAPAIYLNF